MVAAPAVSTTIDGEAMTGILTKTIIPSPVIRWILHACIRHSSINDVVFVGDDSIHVKQVNGQGSLKHIATKDDFDGRIRAAKVFSNRKETIDDDLFLKLEDGDADDPVDNVPPQCLVLTLDSDDLLFLWLAIDEDGSPRFVHQTYPLPRSSKLLYQLGEHLAVDPQSRAIAVAAHEREVVILSAKSKERIQHELRIGDPNWCPVSAQRPLQIQGVIQHMDFLIPPTDDRGNEDEDHIVLLLIVTDQGKTKAVWVDWYAASDIHDAQIHAAQPLDVVRTVPSLLVPLRNAEFLLIHGTEIKRWKDILSGPATSQVMDSGQDGPCYPGASPRQPMWINWSRPRRARRDINYVYLLREDGYSYLFEIKPTATIVSDAGSLDCHAGSAFTSLGGAHGADILAIAGDMSSGSIRSIGDDFIQGHIPDVSRTIWATMKEVGKIQNWASVTDMVVSILPGRSLRTRDGVFVTSCRQPYGAITELRYGLEADLSTYFEFEGRSVTNVWALPRPAVGSLLVLLSSPTGTRLFEISQGEEEEIEELDDVNTGLDSTHSTLAASVTTDGKIVQITEGSLRVTPGTSTNFEDCANIQCESDTSILTAEIDTSHNFAIVAIRLLNSEASYTLHCYKLRTNDPSASGDAQLVETMSWTLDSEPLCSALFATDPDFVFALVATADGQLHAFTVNVGGLLEHFKKIAIPSSPDGVGLCDGITILKSGSAVLGVCGLRDGRLYTVVISPHDSTFFGNNEIIPFSQATVRLSQPPSEQGFAYAMSGLDTCLLTWNGVDASSLRVQNIWTTDRNRPEIVQEALIACTHSPPAHLLASAKLADSLVMITSDEVSVGRLNRAPGVVPHQMEVAGTPNRLIYSEKYRCLVSASVCYDVVKLPFHNGRSRKEGKRQIWPVIDFIPSRGSRPSYTQQLQSGERIYALLEWSVKLDQGKLFSFILVGGSYTRSSGTQRGYIRLLQPQNKNWEVVGVKETRIDKYDAPVYALTLDEDNNIVACIGETVAVLQFDAENRKFVYACPPYKLSSPGVQVTVSPTNGGIQVSTQKDGLISLEMVKDRLVEAGYSMRLATQSIPPQADDLLGHVALTDSNNQNTIMETGVILVSTKYGQLIGLRPNAAGHQSNQHSEIVFEAQLPRSLTRLRTGHFRPRWKPSAPDGMGKECVIGCSADGSITGIATLEEHVWRRLCWVQRLIEWSPLLSPHSYDNPAYHTGDESYARNMRLMPIGLRTQHRDETVTRTDEVAMVEDEVEVRPHEVAMRTNRPRMRDAHIDGDVLSRLLKQKDPEGTLRDILREVASRNDRAGEWVRTHFEEEMAYVGNAVAALRRVLDDWM